MFDFGGVDAGEGVEPAEITNFDDDVVTPVSFVNETGDMGSLDTTWLDDLFDLLLLTMPARAKAPRRNAMIAPKFDPLGLVGCVSTRDGWGRVSDTDGFAGSAELAGGEIVDVGGSFMRGGESAAGDIDVSAGAFFGTVGAGVRVLFCGAIPLARTPSKSLAVGPSSLPVCFRA